MLVLQSMRDSDVMAISEFEGFTRGQLNFLWLINPFEFFIICKICSVSQKRRKNIGAISVFTAAMMYNLDHYFP